MKLKLTFLLVPALASVAQFAPNLFAQSPPNRPERPFRQFQNERRAERRVRFQNLTEDERTRLRAAHQKAMQDPVLQAARDKMRQAQREFREMLRPALLKADPAVQPILDKLRGDRPEKPDRQ